ncbi:MAG TPA: ribonuclease P protein component [Thermoanaerobaculia bacterium]|nr:ribonuclease P protein component [Thermoanaerobaculia bacterium]
MEPAAVAGPRSEALPKTKRLAKRREFLHVYESGRKLFSRFSVVFFIANGFGYSRIGITATKKLGKATERNRLKRWIREVYRQERERLGVDQRSVDIVINLKPNASDACFRDFRQDLAKVLQRLASVPTS